MPLFETWMIDFLLKVTLLARNMFKVGSKLIKVRIITCESTCRNTLISFNTWLYCQNAEINLKTIANSGNSKTSNLWLEDSSSSAKEAPLKPSTFPVPPRTLLDIYKPRIWSPPIRQSANFGSSHCPSFSMFHPHGNTRRTAPFLTPILIVLHQIKEVTFLRFICMWGMSVYKMPWTGRATTKVTYHSHQWRRKPRCHNLYWPCIFFFWMPKISK